MAFSSLSTAGLSVSLQRGVGHGDGGPRGAGSLVAGRARRLLSGGRSRRRLISSWDAMPGILPSTDMPIQAIGGSVPATGKSQRLSQPCIWPIWACWVSVMSVA